MTASGRFVVGEEADGTPWVCEPNGITLEYHAGRPIGRMLAAIAPTDLAKSPLLKPVDVGLNSRLTPQDSGILYLRLNDSPAHLSDNRGQANVTVRRVP